jgi:hypothetical protein
MHLYADGVAEYVGQQSAVELNGERDGVVGQFSGHSTRGPAELASAKAELLRTQDFSLGGPKVDFRAGVPL